MELGIKINYLHSVIVLDLLLIAPPIAFSGITSHCLGTLNVSKLSVDQARAIDKETYKGWTSDQFNQLHPSVFSVFKSTLFLKDSACSGIADKGLFPMMG
jgi:hypothetical protein